MLPQFFEKGSKNSKDNYRSQKVFENIMCKWVATFMGKYFSKFQCGFRNLHWRVLSHSPMSHCIDWKIEKRG